MQVKKITALVLTGALAMALAACGSTQTEAENETQGSQQAEASVAEASSTSEQNTDQTVQDADDILILYFSADNTKDADAVSSATPMPDGESSVKWIADIIQENTGGDLVPVIPSVDYPLDYDELADYAKEETDNGARPAFEDLGVDPTAYKTVFIGYPIWWYEMPMILDTFFDAYDFSGVTIVPFNTHAGSEDGGTYDDIKELEPNATVLDGLAIAGSDTGENSAKKNVEEWLAGLDLD